MMFPAEVANLQLQGAIPASRHAFMGSHSEFCFLDPCFSPEKPKDLETLISTPLGDSPWGWAVHSLSTGSQLFPLLFSSTNPFIHRYHLPVSFRHRSLQSPLYEAFPSTSTCSNSSHCSWFNSSINLFFLFPTIRCELSLFWKQHFLHFFCSIYSIQ